MRPRSEHPWNRRLLALAAAWAMTTAVGPNAAAQRLNADLTRWQAYERSARLQQQRNHEQFAAEMAEYQRLGDEQLRYLAELKTRLQSCGNCPDRTALQTEIAQIENGRREALRVFCTSMGAIEALNPLTGSMIGRLAGSDAVCGSASETDRRRAEREANRIHRLPLEERARSGNPDDVLRLSQWFRKMEQDTDTACHLLSGPAARGHGPSVAVFAGQCLMASGLPADIERGTRMLEQCAAQGSPDCEADLRARRRAVQ